MSGIVPGRYAGQASEHIFSLTVARATAMLRRQPLFNGTQLIGIVLPKLTRIWHVPAKHANRMDARTHTSTLAECAPRFMTPRSQGFVGQSSPNLAHV